MENKEIPVLLLTGYLGSGKTTLLNRILSNKKGIKFAVIVNDIGEVNIDAELIEKGGIVGQKDDSLVALQNGCICCSLKMDLVEQLHDITSMKKFDYIVIEASGICEPAPIAQTICSMPNLDAKYSENGEIRLDCIASVVDAVRLQSEFRCGDDLQKKHLEDDDIENLVIQQIEFCNMILLNKAADVKPEELKRIKEILKAIQPKAEIVECNYGDVELDKLVNTHLLDFEKVATSATWINEIEKHVDEDDDDDDEHEHHHHHHDHDEHEHEHHHDHEHEDHSHCDHEHGVCHCGHHHDKDHPHGDEYGIGTFVYFRRQAFDLNKFDDFVARRWPKSIIRAKGMCYFKEKRDMCYVFEQAGIQKSVKEAGLWYATMPEDELAELMRKEPGLARDWDEEYGDRMIKLVFIGQHMDKDAIIKELDMCLE